MSNETERLIIGEGERAGWPISAPIVGDSGGYMMRWTKRGDGTFALEYWRSGDWIEVPVLSNPITL
jgi:hypothetical protein